MLVYDITNEKSFENIKNWIRNIEEHASSDVDRIIIGNKCDVEERRQVSRERGEQVQPSHVSLPLSDFRELFKMRGKHTVISSFMFMLNQLKDICAFEKD